MKKIIYVLFFLAIVGCDNEFEYQCDAEYTLGAEYTEERYIYENVCQADSFCMVIDSLKWQGYTGVSCECIEIKK